MELKVPSAPFLKGSVAALVLHPQAIAFKDRIAKPTLEPILFSDLVLQDSLTAQVAAFSTSLSICVMPVAGASLLLLTSMKTSTTT
jgi:hypothetical protein